MDGTPDDLREIKARRGYSVFYRGKTLLSTVDPVAQAERIAAEIPVKERTLYFCPSPIYGYGLAFLLERLGDELHKQNSVILCTEADEKLFEISATALAPYIEDSEISSGEFKPLALLKATNEESICAFVRKTWGGRQFRRVVTIHLTGGWQIFPGLYEDLARALSREIAVEWGNAMTLIRLGRLYSRNLVRNFPLLLSGRNITSLDFGGAPVLLLGAGPSLDAILDELAVLFGGNLPGKDRRNFRIICADTCLPAMEERGIMPDLVVVLESQHWNLRAFTGSCGRRIDAAFDISSLPASARVLDGKRYLFATPWTELKFFKRILEAGLLPEMFAPLGSVGLSCVALVLNISNGPVITVGLDFSYSIDAYHARSTPGHKEQERRQNRFRSIINFSAAFREGAFSARSKNDTKVYSDPAMRNYRDLFIEEFGGNPRLFDIWGPGFDLGIKTISVSEAFAILNGRGCPKADALSKPADKGPDTSDPHPANHPWKPEAIAAFIRQEINTLTELNQMLQGTIPSERERMEELLNTADYLWAHFPECAGAGGRRPAGTDLGFLKRVRTEIEPFLKLWNMTINELEKNIP